MDTKRSLTGAPPSSTERPCAAAVGEGPGFWRLNGINLFWFASQGLWNAIYILLAISAGLVDPQRKELVVGWATALGGVIAVVAPVAAGALSDRTRTRWGRRTPWIVGGTLVNLVGLGLLVLAGATPVLLLAYVVFQLGNNMAEAAFAGVIPDLVPPERRGGASGLLNSASTVGTVAYLALTLLVLSALGSTRAGATATYLAIGVVLAAGLLVSVPLMHEGPFELALEPLRFRELLRGIATPLRAPSFAWVIATRIFQTLGVWTILPFITFYFQDVTHAGNPGAASSLWLLAVLAGGIVPAVACGYLSDRWRRRKPFVYVSSGMQAAVTAVLLLTLVSDLRLVYALGILFGIGFGAYSAVDWALACDTLPEGDRSAARDMALFHVAFTLPQVVGPALLAPALYLLNRPGGVVAGIATGHGLGFRIVFASASIWFVLATVMVRNVRGVR
jgi:Na+/melibiose symporter-like transporter